MSYRNSSLSRRAVRAIVVVTAALGLGTVAIRGHSVSGTRQHSSDQLARLAAADGLDGIAQPGDLIFRRGAGAWTEVFSRASRQEGFFSHVGIVTREPGGLHVWHAEGDDLRGQGGVRNDPLSVFLKDAKGIALGKLSLDTSPSEIVRQATAITWANVPFDTKFRLDDKARAVYCTEYVWESIRRASGRDIVTNKTVIGGVAGIAVDDLYINNNIRIVYQRRL